MNIGRYAHSAFLLTNGKVLIAGGIHNGTILNSAELYDPSTGTWKTTSNMHNERYDHKASVLRNGKVLVTGGEIDKNLYNAKFGTILNSAELYDPSTETWKTTSNMHNERYDHKASVLRNGKVLVTGGEIDKNLYNAKLYDLSTRIWAQTDKMNNGRLLAYSICIKK
ncbi:unnamed protein product [Rotaria sp. Silwood1]|nr:unnamed protein product [Rotaria sp. Silwood1]